MQAYLDNNASTKPTPEVTEAMVQSLHDDWANPSSLHRAGQKARQKMELAREQVTALIGCKPSELIFTSGATEANNLFIRGICELKPDKKTIITTNIEHAAIKEPCNRLIKHGYNIIHTPINADGVVDTDALKTLLNENQSDLALVSIHAINNETGVIQPYQTIGQLCKEHNILYHSDATQAIGKIPFNLTELPIDAISFSAHKLHGPKGIGGLALQHTRLFPQILGGPHERERRGGTENTPAISGFGVAAQQAKEFVDSDKSPQLEKLRDKLEHTILSQIDIAIVNGAGAKRIWNTSNISFPALGSEAILLMLSERGISAASGSACSSGAMTPSSVLTNMGLDEKTIHGSIRLSLSRFSTPEEIDYAIENIPVVIKKLQAILPV